MSRPPDPDELRRRADRALSPQAPEALRRAVWHARLRLDRDVEGWDTSIGHTRAHRLGFGTDAASLASLRHSPSLFELLCEAFATAFALDEGQSLFDLRPHWALGPPPHAHGPYRGEGAWPEAERDDAEALREAALAYLDVVGDEPGRHWLDNATLLLRPEGAGVRIDAKGRGRFDAHTLEAALVDLLQGYEGRPVSVHIASR